MVNSSGNLFSYFMKAAGVLFVATLALAAGRLAPAQSPIKVLLVTGQSNRYHNWEVSSPIVKRQLEESGRFAVTVATTPPKGTAPNQDMSGFAPKFSDYQAIVLDYEGFEFAPPVKQAFVDYVKDGGGLVVLHAADNAFPGWAEYNEMIGIGGWGGFTPGYANRTQAAGPKIRWRDGGMVLDNDTPGNAQHPSPHDFLMTVRAPEVRQRADLPRHARPRRGDAKRTDHSDEFGGLHRPAPTRHRMGRDGRRDDPGAARLSDRRQDVDQVSVRLTSPPRTIERAESPSTIPTSADETARAGFRLNRSIRIRRRSEWSRQ
jgi:hypothetical protein